MEGKLRLLRCFLHPLLNVSESFHRSDATHLASGLGRQDSHALGILASCPQLTSGLQYRRDPLNMNIAIAAPVG